MELQVQEGRSILHFRLLLGEGVFHKPYRFLVTGVGEDSSETGIGKPE
jgi:hypothetical protein